MQNIRQIGALKNQQDKLRRAINEADVELASRAEDERHSLAIAKAIRDENSNLKQSIADSLDEITQFQNFLRETSLVATTSYSRLVNVLCADSSDDDPGLADASSAINELLSMLHPPQYGQVGNVMNADNNEGDLPTYNVTIIDAAVDMAYPISPENVHISILMTETPTSSRYKQSSSPMRLSDRFLTVRQDIIGQTLRNTASSSFSIENVPIASSTHVTEFSVVAPDEQLSIAERRTRRAAAPTCLKIPSFNQQVLLIGQYIESRLNKPIKREKSVEKHKK